MRGAGVGFSPVCPVPSDQIENVNDVPSPTAAAEAQFFLPFSF
jgi:hypothetical protein